MSAGALCGAAPFFFRKKHSVFERKSRGDHGSTKAFKGSKKKKGLSSVRSSCRVAGILVTMTELRNKVSTLRDLLDFSPCPGSVSVNEMLILTRNDLFKRYPKLRKSKIKDVPMHKALKLFCDTLKSLGDMWTTDEWMARCKYDSSKKLEQLDLEHIALGLLDEIIKLARERLFDELDDNDDNNSRPSNAFGKALTDSCSGSPMSLSSSPLTPTSVLPEARKSFREKGSYSYSPPMLLPLRVQAIEKLNPIDIKRLSFHIFPHTIALTQQENTQDSKRLSIDKPHDDEMMSEIDKKDEEGIEFPVEKMDEIVRKWIGLIQRKCDDDNNSSVVPNRDVKTQTPPPPPPPPPPATNPITSPQQNVAAPPPPPPASAPPPPPPQIPANNPITPPQPPPPPPQNVAAPSPPPPPASAPPPPPTSIPRGSPPVPPPPGSKGAAPPPPVPLGAKRGGGPPPPPGFAILQAKKCATKLKRSSQMSNLYRVLKGKVEGSSVNGKPTGGRKGKVGAAAAGGKQGMADALAEMTKRSAYFIQIEEDVKNHAETIKDLKIKISTFETSDMAELLQFHNYVESRLEKLTDETQVLARFENFPCKKLEAVRMATALYSKLDSIATTLHEWPVVTPVSKLLDKAESYFNKIKVEMDALERTKDEELKRFKAQKINFDFGILLRIKESMVDVSSNCMEMALKEKREALDKENKEPNKLDEKKSGSQKMLWRAFQFAFRVYTFAGGHDDRADKLTRELAREIETEH